jgi:hypothetical protein
MGICADLVRATVALAALGIASGQTRQVEIVDPILKMRAYSMTIPANWFFEGLVMQGTSCVAGPFPVFRLMSPDGITEIKMLPRFDWKWSTLLPKVPNPASQDCLPLDKEMPASQFLQYMVAILGVTFVREAPPEHLAEESGPGRKVDRAGFLVRYRINGIPVEEYLRATVTCRDDARRPGQDAKVTHFHSCSAQVSRTRTRAGQLDAPEATLAPIWRSLAVDNINAVSAQGSQMLAKMGGDANRALQAQHDSLVQSQALRQRQHEQFLSVLPRGTDGSMKAARGSMDARSRMAGDWADYALDREKRLDPGAGHSYTWVDAFGKRYQTNDLNDIPNGRLKGDWTLQPNVH